MKTKKKTKTKATRATRRKPLIVLTRGPGSSSAFDGIDGAKADAERLGYDVLVIPCGAHAAVMGGHSNG